MLDIPGAIERVKFDDFLIIVLVQKGLEKLRLEIWPEMEFRDVYADVKSGYPVRGRDQAVNHLS